MVSPNANYKLKHLLHPEQDPQAALFASCNKTPLGRSFFIMKKPISKNQKVFFLALSAFLTASAVVATFIAVPKNTKDNFDLPIFSKITSAIIPASPSEKFEAQTQKNTAEEASDQNSIEPQTEKKIHIAVQAGDFSISLTQKEGTTLFDALTEAKDNGKILFDGKQYPSLGFFVTKIGSLSELGGKHLIYYINGKPAKAGVSLYVLKDGDVIDWKLE